MISHIIGSNNSSLLQPNNKLSIPIDLKANIDRALLNKEYLLDLLNGPVEHCTRWLRSWLQVLKEMDHEVSVVLVVPVKQDDGSPGVRLSLFVGNVEVSMGEEIAEVVE